MEFKKLNDKIIEQFNKMQEFKLFRLELSGHEIWEAYLNGFAPEENPVFRDPNSSEANCNHDRHFIQRYGNVVAVTPDSHIISLFDIDVKGTKYERTIKGLKRLCGRSKIADVFVETYGELQYLPYEKIHRHQILFRLGHVKTLKVYTQEEVDKFGVVNTKDIYTFDHFHVFLNKDFVFKDGRSNAAIMGEFRMAKEVFKRGMDEIPLDTLILVRDLINQGSLLDGTAHLYKVNEFIKLKEEYDKLRLTARDNWCWDKSHSLPIAKFKNELIGVLCTELAEGKSLNEACLSWNKRVDPANYMKAKAPITKRQIEDAKRFVVDNGYEESFSRRPATLEDIKISGVLHTNAGDGKIKPASIFDNVKATSSRHKRSEFDKVEEVSIDKFVKDILPTCTSVEVLLTSKMKGNLVTLTTANNTDSKPIFKWNNNFSWTFNGNLAGKSQIKEEVKKAGGNVDGVLRASLTWNESGLDNSDLDLWCKQPNGQLIGFSTIFRKDRGDFYSDCGGQLDLDKIVPEGKLAIENIYFRSLSELINGTYNFYVIPFNPINGKGFKVEIEFDGETYQYDYNTPLIRNKIVPIADVIVRNGNFSILHHLPSIDGVGASSTMYGLETNQFHKANVICLSPNHWGDDNVGNKHYFFMLEGCKYDSPIRTFHNENLKPDLLVHRKVLEVLGEVSKVEPTDRQLSGVGFNSTVRDEVILRLQGSHKRVIKVKF